MATSSRDAGVEAGFARRTLFVFALAAALFLVWQLSAVLLLVFSAVIVAVLLRSIADPIAARTPLPAGVAVALAGLTVVAVIAGALWLFGAVLAEQTRQLVTHIPTSAAELRTMVSGLPFSEQITRIDGSGLMGGASGVVGRVGGYAMSTVSVATSLVLVIIAGVFLAVSPRVYRDGLVVLFPPERRASLREAADTTGRALKAWLVGQLTDMAVVGVMTGVGLALIGLPSPLALGLIAGLLAFVPIVGSIAGAIPALLVAAQGGWELMAWTLLVYVVVQQVEGNLIYPFIQKRAVKLPPVLTLFGILGFGTLFGFLGVFVATPLMVVLFVNVRLLYLRRTLDEDIAVPGEVTPG
ncbi:MAG: AI-2E family transporter [Brevundimonas sp.]|uniref:AI-2E family transporter n=1 Tax=Brevundimonas sp. TaxID=1871086 RepID=UPI0017B99DF2|nr:AI-2E family transporter [Brevundimonas sp.]MBA4804338.1 AI-2E family transporter [Brevundimonas sp.]